MKLTGDQKLALLKTAFTVGAHVPKHGKTKYLWLEVNRDFFNQECMKPQKQHFHDEWDSGARKTYDQFKTICDEARNKVEGNTSALQIC